MAQPSGGESGSQSVLANGGHPGPETGLLSRVDDGDDALRTELQDWEPESRAALSRALAAVG